MTPMITPIRPTFDATEEALIADLAPVLEKHGMNCGWISRGGAEYLVLCLRAQALLEYHRVARMVEEMPPQAHGSLNLDSSPWIADFLNRDQARDSA